MRAPRKEFGGELLHAFTSISDNHHLLSATSSDLASGASEPAARRPSSPNIPLWFGNLRLRADLRRTTSEVVSRATAGRGDHHRLILPRSLLLPVSIVDGMLLVALRTGLAKRWAGRWRSRCRERTRLYRSAPRPPDGSAPNRVHPVRSQIAAEDWYPRGTPPRGVLVLR